MLKLHLDSSCHNAVLQLCGTSGRRIKARNRNLQRVPQKTKLRSPKQKAPTLRESSYPFRKRVQRNLGERPSPKCATISEMKPANGKNLNFSSGMSQLNVAVRHRGSLPITTTRTRAAASLPTLQATPPQTLPPHCLPYQSITLLGNEITVLPTLTVPEYPLVHSLLSGLDNRRIEYISKDGLCIETSTQRQKPRRTPDPPYRSSSLNQDQ